MVVERRNFPSDVVATAPPESVLHDALLCASESLARGVPVLPVLGRPNTAHHVDCTESGIWRWYRRRLPKLQKGEKGVFMFARW